MGHLYVRIRRAQPSALRALTHAYAYRVRMDHRFLVLLLKQ